MSEPKKAPVKMEIGDFIILHYPGVPKAVQSMRVARIGNFMRKYQPKDVMDWKNYIKVLTMEQLWEGFTPLCANKGECIELRVVFTFPLRSSEPKKIQKFVAEGGRILHNRKPDVTDNLLKGLADALTGILWTDDSKVCIVSTLKVDGETPSTDLSVKIRPDWIYRLDIDAYLRGHGDAIQWSVAIPGTTMA